MGNKQCKPMNKTFIKVQSGVEFISEIPNFELPNGIFNKKHTSCGGTTMALTDNHPTIICAPRRMMLINKAEQYENVLLVMGGVTELDIISYLQDCKGTPKILTTYDSIMKIVNSIENYYHTFDGWRVVVDEFHIMLKDAGMKPDVEYNFIKEVKKLPYVTFLSATPTMDKYLQKLGWFNDVDYYELDWEDETVIKVIAQQTNRPLSYVDTLIKNYKQGIYLEANGKKATEIIIFLNSVKSIVNLIDRNNLKPEEVNILVAETDRNYNLIKKLGDEFEEGRIPKEKEESKMFTFATSTCNCGCDFYTKNAMIVIVSDCKALNTSVNIYEDIEQCSGRLRCKENPFRNTVLYIYNQNIVGKYKSKEEFERLINSAKETQMFQISRYNNNDNEESRKLELSMFREWKENNDGEMDFMYYNEATGMYEINDIAIVNEEYNYEIQYETYTSGVKVRAILKKKNFNLDNKGYSYLEEVIRMTIRDTTFVDQFKDYCTLRDNNDSFFGTLGLKNPMYSIYYEVLGSAKCKALNYQESKLKKAYGSLTGNDLIKKHISKMFITNKAYKASDVKNKLSVLYKELGINKAAKASDLKDYFEIESKTMRFDGISQMGILIIRKK